MKIRELLSEISLGNYYTKAHQSRMKELPKTFFADPDKPEVKDATRKIKNREAGMQRAGERTRKHMAAKASQARADAVASDKANIHQLKAELANLEAKFDPNYEYSDDYTEWNKHKHLHSQISALKHRIAQASMNETATVGATSSANIASVPNPNYANKANKKKVKSVSALDTKGVSLFGGPAFKR